MTEIAVALITSAGLVLVAVVGAIPVLLPLIRRVKAIQSHVENDHKKADGSPLILRDDLDQKHEENGHKLDQMLSILLPVQRDVAWLMRRQAETDDRLDGLADTLNPRKDSP